MAQRSQVDRTATSDGSPASSAPKAIGARVSVRFGPMASLLPSELRGGAKAVRIPKVISVAEKIEGAAVSENGQAVQEEPAPMPELEWPEADPVNKGLSSSMWARPNGASPSVPRPATPSSWRPPRARPASSHRSTSNHAPAPRASLNPVASPFNFQPIAPIPAPQPTGEPVLPAAFVAQSSVPSPAVVEGAITPVSEMVSMVPASTSEPAVEAPASVTAAPVEREAVLDSALASGDDEPKSAGSPFTVWGTQALPSVPKCERPAVESTSAVAPSPSSTLASNEARSATPVPVWGESVPATVEESGVSRSASSVSESTWSPRTASSASSAVPELSNIPESTRSLVEDATTPSAQQQSKWSEPVATCTDALFIPAPVSPGSVAHNNSQAYMSDAPAVPRAESQFTVLGSEPTPIAAASQHSDEVVVPAITSISVADEVNKDRPTDASFDPTSQTAPISYVDRRHMSPIPLRTATPPVEPRTSVKVVDWSEDVEDGSEPDDADIFASWGLGPNRTDPAAVEPVEEETSTRVNLPPSLAKTPRRTVRTGPTMSLFSRATGSIARQSAPRVHASPRSYPAFASTRDELDSSTTSSPPAIGVRLPRVVA